MLTRKRIIVENTAKSLGKSSDDISGLGVGLWPKPQPGGITIGGTFYTEHALGRMAPLGNVYIASNGEKIIGRGIPSSVVQNALKNGTKTKGTQPGTIDITYENIFITVSDNLKRIITVIKKS